MIKERCKKCRKYHFKIYIENDIWTINCSNCGILYAKLKHGENTGESAVVKL